MKEIYKILAFRIIRIMIYGMIFVYAFVVYNDFHLSIWYVIGAAEYVFFAYMSYVVSLYLQFKENMLNAMQILAYIIILAFVTFCISLFDFSNLNKFNIFELFLFDLKSLILYHGGFLYVVLFCTLLLEFHYFFIKNKSLSALKQKYLE